MSEGECYTITIGVRAPDGREVCGSEMRITGAFAVVENYGQLSALISTLLGPEQSDKMADLIRRDAAARVAPVAADVPEGES